MYDPLGHFVVSGDVEQPQSHDRQAEPHRHHHPNADRLDTGCDTNGNGGNNGNACNDDAGQVARVSF